MDNTYQNIYDTELNKQEELKRISKNIAVDNIETATRQSDANTENATKNLLQVKHHKDTHREKLYICGIVVYFIVVCAIIIISLHFGRS
jgi:cell division protein FtsL